MVPCSKAVLWHCLLSALREPVVQAGVWFLFLLTRFSPLGAGTARASGLIDLFCSGVENAEGRR